MMEKRVTVFISYAHEDEALRQELDKHLSQLIWQNLIDVWHDRDISAGMEWENEIDAHLNKADIILLLVSPDFIASRYCYSVEMQRAMKRHRVGDARVIPVILRPVDWEGAPFSQLQALPQDAIPVVDRKWHTRDEAFVDVVKGIRKAIQELILHSRDRSIESSDYKNDSSSSAISEDGSSSSVRRDYEAAFVGRQTEQDRFRQVVSSHIDQPKKHLFLISGPGGFGKSWLANKLCQIANVEWGIPSVMIDWKEHADTATTVINVMEVVAARIGQQLGLTFDAFNDVIEVNKHLETEVDALRKEYLTLQSQQDDSASQFEAYLAQRLSDVQKALRENPTITLSKAFINDMRTKLSTIGPAIICFDTYERIDYYRHGGYAQNFADEWVRKLIQESPENLLFVISGREDHTDLYNSRFVISCLDSFSLDVFSLVDVSRYAQAHLGERAEVLTRKIFTFSQGVPLLVSMAIEVIKAFPNESYEDIFDTEQDGSQQADIILKTAATRFLQYVQKNQMLLLLTCFTSIIQLKNDDGLQRDLVRWTFERRYPHFSHIGTLIESASRSFSSVFLQPAFVRPELRSIIVDALLNRQIKIDHSDFDLLLRQADIILTDLIALEDETQPEEPSRYATLVAQHINICAWIDPEKCIRLFLRECLVRTIQSFESFRLFIDLIAKGRVVQALPDITRKHYFHLIEDISRASFYKFLQKFPPRFISDSWLQSLFEIVQLYLEVIIKSNSKDAIQALTRDERVEKKTHSLAKKVSDSSEIREGYYLRVGLVEIYLEYAQVLERGKLYQREMAVLQSALPLLAELPPHYRDQRLNYVYLRLAKLAVLVDDFFAARSFADQARDISPDDTLTLEFQRRLPELIEARATSLMTRALNRIRQQSKVDSEAIEKLEEAAKLNPEDPNVYRSLIRAYRRDREHTKALEVSRKLLEIDPLNISGIIGRGEVLYEQGHFAEAEATFRHAMDLAKQIGEEVLNLYTNLGRCCVMQGSYNEALTFFDKRIEGGLDKINYYSSNLKEYKRLMVQPH